MSKYKEAVADGVEWPYKVYADGSIHTTPNRYNGFVERPIVYRTSWNGYHRMTLHHQGVARQIHAHRVVAETWVSNPHNKPFVNHKNGIKKDNRPENLEWCSRAENTHHAVNNNLIRSALDSDKVLEVKARLKEGIKGKELAKQYSVSEGTISFIKNGRTWK